jgi:uncharacterized membrane protein
MAATKSADGSRDTLSRSLGWASLGLGVPQVLRPGGFAKSVGVDDDSSHRAVTAFVGVRELAAAAGLLRRTSPGWLWARVGGDAFDLAVLGRALKNHDGKAVRRTVVATAAVAGIAAVDLYAAITRSRKGQSMELKATTTVVKPPQEVYAFWRQLDNLQTFMAHVEEVRSDGDKSHWRATAPFGQTVEWDAEITEDVPGERIAWKSLADADIDNSGVVRFLAAPGDRGTEVHVTLNYSVPAGKLGEALAKYFGEDPHQQLDDDLRRFKQAMETGQIVRSDGAPWGKHARKEFPQRPAQPMSDEEFAELAEEVSL